MYSKLINEKMFITVGTVSTVLTVVQYMWPLWPCAKNCSPHFLCASGEVVRSGFIYAGRRLELPLLICIISAVHCAKGFCHIYTFWKNRLSYRKRQSQQILRHSFGKLLCQLQLRQQSHLRRIFT